MKRVKPMKNIGSRATTFIEIMVVVAILSVLLAFVLNHYILVGAGARPVKAMSDLNSIKQTIKLFCVQSGQYPPSVEALVGKYIPYLPVDPWGSPYKLDTQKLEIFCVNKDNGQRIALSYKMK